MLRFFNHLRMSFWKAFEHDAFAVAKAAAFSAILTLFPAVLVIASILSMSSTTETFFKEIYRAVGRILPEGTSDLGPRHLPFKPGVARILERALSAGANVTVVPVGIFYTAADAFRSDVTVVHGPRIATDLPRCATERERCVSRRWIEKGIPSPA